MFANIISLIRKRIIIIIILLIIALISGKLLYDRQQKIEAEEIESLISVGKHNLKQTLTLAGKIDAEEKADLRFKTSGRLSWVGVKVGERVKKHQTIATLDKRDVQKNLEKILNSYMNERWDFDQAHDDYDEGQVITDDLKRILEKAQFDLNNSVLDVELYHLAIEYANLWTPIAGIVTHIDTPVAGINITPATAEFNIVNPDSIYFSAVADQTEVVNLTNGMNAEVVLDAYEDASVSGSIKSISFIPKPGESGTVYEVKVEIPVDNSGLKYRLEMAGDTTFIIAEEENALAIPISAVGQENGDSYVFKKVNNKKEKQFITTGDEFDDEIIVLSGLSVGDQIYD